MNGLHLLTDNQDISEHDYAKARTLLGEVRTLHLESRRYVEGNGLDQTIVHVDAVAAAIDRFSNHTFHPGPAIARHMVAERPNTFVRRNRVFA